MIARTIKNPVRKAGLSHSKYSHNGRARYWFTINVFKYPKLFDLDSLKNVGFRSKENLNGYTRDHTVNVNEAIKNNYDPYYITHVMNCELMLWITIRKILNHQYHQYHITN